MTRNFEIQSFDCLVVLIFVVGIAAHDVCSSWLHLQCETDLQENREWEKQTSVILAICVRQCWRNYGENRNCKHFSPSEAVVSVMSLFRVDEV